MHAVSFRKYKFNGKFRSKTTSLPFTVLSLSVIGIVYSNF